MSIEHPLQHLVDWTNQVLRTTWGHSQNRKEFRTSVCVILEDKCKEHGVKFTSRPLQQDEVPEGDLAGIYVKKMSVPHSEGLSLTCRSFRNTDETRKRYSITH